MMQRWNPFQDLRQMQDTMDRMWRRAGDDPQRSRGRRAGESRRGPSPST